MSTYLLLQQFQLSWEGISQGLGVFMGILGQTPRSTFKGQTLMLD